MTRTATRCCGSASITVRDDPYLNGVCHCNDCKRRTGSAFGWSAYFTDEQVLAKSGEWAVYKPKAAPGQIRHACKHCSSMLWWTSPTMPGMGVAGGAFTDIPLPEPTGTYRHANHVPWFQVPTHWDRIS